jgi:hypothetical protein
VLLGNSIGGFGAKTDFGTGTNPASVAIGDLNADGKPDLAVANWGSNTVSVLLGNGNGTFGANTEFGTGTNPYSVAIGDLNADGKPDLAVPNLRSYTVSVLLGNGNGTFGANTEFGTGTNPFSVAIGDLNGDGKPDLAVANGSSSTVSVLLGNGDGSFGEKTDFGTGAVPYSVAIADFNADGRPDLAVANAGSSTVSVLTNLGPPTTDVPGVTQNSGEWLAMMPNPAADIVRIEFALPRTGKAKLEVFDMTGRRVARVFDGTLGAGSHRIQWAGPAAAGRRAIAGIYMVRLVTNETVRTSRLVWIPR